MSVIVWCGTVMVRRQQLKLNRLALNLTFKLISNLLNIKFIQTAKHTPTHTHAYTRTSMHTHTLARMHAHADAHTRTRKNTHTHMHTGAHTHRLIVKLAGHDVGDLADPPVPLHHLLR